jgi:serine/threonine protein kinase
VAQTSTPSFSSPEEASRYCTFCKSSFRMEILRCPRDGAPVEVRAEDPLIGELLGGRYRIVSTLGFGGMGRVYRAEVIGERRTVAIKVLHGDLAADEKMVARFEREARAISRLSSPHIVAIVDFGTSPQGLLYLAMELLAGKPLHEVIAREGPLSTERSLHICKQIALGLEHAHNNGLIHRDLKPANVVLSDKMGDPDFATILDFGLARMTETNDPRDAELLTSMGVIRGTPEFMSPEQARGLDLDRRSDIYALGVLLFLMLTQRFPFPRPKSRLDVLTMHVMTPPYPLSKFIHTTTLIEQLTAKLLAKEPRERFQTGKEVVASIEHVLGNGPAPIPKTIPPDDNETENEPTRIFASMPSGKVQFTPLSSPRLQPEQATLLTDELRPSARNPYQRITLIAGVSGGVLLLALIIWLALGGQQHQETLIITPTKTPQSTTTTAAPIISEPSKPIIVPTPDTKPVETAPVKDPNPVQTPDIKTIPDVKPPKPPKVEKPPKVDNQPDSSAKASCEKTKNDVEDALSSKELSKGDLSYFGLGDDWRDLNSLCSTGKAADAVILSSNLIAKIKGSNWSRSSFKPKVEAVQKELEAAEGERGKEALASLRESFNQFQRGFADAVMGGNYDYDGKNKVLNSLRGQISKARK